MIKKYTSSDEEKLSELLKRTQEDTNLVTISKSTSCIASYAAYEHGKMIGFIAAWKSKIHPFCTYFRCTTRNKQIGLAADLMEYMESDMKASDYPLQTSLDSSSALVDNYHNQLTLVRKTYLPTITLANIPYASSLDESERVLSFDTIKGNSHIVKKLATLVKKIYEETHQVNPIAELSLSTWQNMIFMEDLIEEGSYLYLNDNNEILAYSLLHHSEIEDRVEFGWKGSNHISNKEKINLLVELQINFAKRKGFRLLEGEFDDTDAYAMEVLNHFSFPRDTVLLTYQKA